MMPKSNLDYYIIALQDLQERVDASDWPLTEGLISLVTKLQDDLPTLPEEFTAKILAVAGDFQVAQRNAKSR
jgi:hypothetical protein